MDPINVLCELTPPRVLDTRLRQLVCESIARIRSDLVRLAPHSASEMNRWIDRQGNQDAPEDCFLGLKAHFLLIPWCLELRIRGDIDLEFQRQLVYSSINAYYFVRLVDNISDGHSPSDLPLLPLAALFHSNFQASYSMWFEPNSPFWGYFDRLWVGMADATVHSSQPHAFTESEFIMISSQKIAAVKIPVAAVCFRYQQPAMLAPWLELYDRFACSHEMLDDLCDWHADLIAGSSSFLLSEATRRKHVSESIYAYLVREGLATGYAKIETWLAECSSLARALGSPLLDSFLQYRSEQVETFWRSIAPSLEQLRDLADVLEGPYHGPG